MTKNIKASQSLKGRVGSKVVINLQDTERLLVLRRNNSHLYHLLLLWLRNILFLLESILDRRAWVLKLCSFRTVLSNNASALILFCQCWEIGFQSQFLCAFAWTECKRKSFVLRSTLLMNGPKVYRCLCENYFLFFISSYLLFDHTKPQRIADVHSKPRCCHLFL